jgi:hypothetical protein
MQLNWVFDEYFVQPAAWKTIFAPRGVRSRPVENSKGEVLRTVIQLVIDEEVEIETDNLEAEVCQVCKRIRYKPMMRGPFPALRTSPASSMARTREYFGSGASSDHRIVVAQELAREMAANSVRGASFRPTATAQQKH